MPTRVPRLWPVLLASTAAAAWLSLSHIQGLQYADSVVPSLVSLVKWTPFYWDQDRFGMLVPLLAMPFRHPAANLFVQSGLNLVAGFASLMLLPRYLLRNGSWPVVGAVNAVLFLALAPEGYRFGYLVAAQPFGIPLTLAVCALVLLERQPMGWAHTVGAAVLLALAHWVNVGTWVFVAPLVLTRAWTAGELGKGKPWLEREVTRSFALTALGGGIGLALARLLARRATLLNPLPPSQWPSAWRAVASNAWAQLTPHWLIWACLALGAAGIAGLAHPTFRARAPDAVRAAGALAVAAVPFCLYVAALRWVKENESDYRYVVPGLIYLQTAAVMLALGPLVSGISRRWGEVATLVGAGALIAISGALYGMPSPGGARADIDRVLGPRTSDILQAGVTHVIGDYWAVWPSVFHANLVLYEQGSDRRVWGVSHRSWATHEQWLAVPVEQMTFAVPKGDALWEHWQREYGLPQLDPVESLPTIDVLRPRRAP